MKVNAVSGRVYALAVRNSQNPPNFKSKPDNVWIYLNNAWLEINREVLHKMMYPEDYVVRMSMRRRCSEQMDRIERDNNLQMKRYRLTPNDIEHIKRKCDIYG